MQPEAEIAGFVNDFDGMPGVALEHRTQRVPGAGDVSGEEFEVAGPAGEMPAFVVQIYADVNDLAVREGNVVFSRHGFSLLKVKEV